MSLDQEVSEDVLVFFSQKSVTDRDRIPDPCGTGTAAAAALLWGVVPPSPIFYNKYYFVQLGHAHLKTESKAEGSISILQYAFNFKLILKTYVKTLQPNSPTLVKLLNS